MEIKVIEKGKNMLKFEIIGEDHTFCNALRKELWNDGDVVIAGYNIQHGLVDIPLFTVQTKTKSPKAAIEAAVKRLKANNKKLSELFSKL